MESAFQSGFASASLQVLFDKFSTFALNEIGLIWGVDDELYNLERTMLKIQVLIDDFESKNIRNKAWKVWLQDIKNVSCEADDLLDDISMELLKLNGDPSFRSANRSQVRDMVLSRFKFSLPHEINKLRKKLNGILSEMDSHLMTKIMKSSELRMTKRCSSSLFDEFSVVGRENDKKKLIEELLSDDISDDTISVIPIVGIGGIGKSTLAQMVYNDATTIDYFDLQIWVHVSIEFDIQRITKSMLELVSGKVQQFSDLELFQVRLRKILKEKIFLIVFDDLWNENPIDWDVVTLPLRVGAKGSRILVTTRSTIVSRIVATTSSYFLQPLQDKDCWEIIKRKAFSNKNLTQQETLEVVGQQIAQKCKGVPLAAKTLGSVLYFKSEETQWITILKSEIWDLHEDKDEIFPTLRLSYDQLSAPLRRCFAHCSNFPPNYEFQKNELVQLWIAEGFVQPNVINRIEDVAADYFDELLWRSFFHFSHKNHFGKEIYTMHGLIHNLAQVVSMDTSFHIRNELSSLLPMFTNVHQYSVAKQPRIIQSFSKFKHSRTLMLGTYGSSIVRIPYMLFAYLRSLRALDVSNTGISELPDSIGTLNHLRFLNVSKTNIRKLPDSITKLYWLQTIKLEDCKEFLHLPMATKNLTQLRHLDLNVKLQLSSMPPEFGKLTSLQSLSAFIVGKDKGYRVEELMHMKDLRGAICITNLENVANMDQAHNARLWDKTYLDKLELEWESSKDRKLDQEVLSGLQPHSQLKELQLMNYGGFAFPGWLGQQSFCKLESITMSDCHNCILLPPLGRLPLLKSLEISRMRNLASVGNNFCGERQNIPGFPMLEFLKFHDMPRLQRWEGLHCNDMPQLRKLIVSFCRELILLPSLHQLNSLESLDVSRCPQLQSLPEEGLPLSLKSLIISECDILKERCKIEGGEDWSKIKEIQYVEIDFVPIKQDSGCPL